MENQSLRDWDEWEVFIDKLLATKESVLMEVSLDFSKDDLHSIHLLFSMKGPQLIWIDRVISITDRESLLYAFDVALNLNDRLDTDNWDRFSDYLFSRYHLNPHGTVYFFWDLQHLKRNDKATYKLLLSTLDRVGNLAHKNNYPLFAILRS